MAVTAVFDTQNRLERYIRPDTPDEYRAALLSGTDKAVRTASAQVIIKDELDRRVSVLIDNMQDRATLHIEGDDTVLLTKHDLVRIAQFFTRVSEELS